MQLKRAEIRKIHATVLGEDTLPFRSIVRDPENIPMLGLWMVVEGRLDLAEPAADLEMPLRAEDALVLEDKDPVVAHVLLDLADDFVRDSLLEVDAGD